MLRGFPFWRNIDFLLTLNTILRDDTAGWLSLECMLSVGNAGVMDVACVLQLLFLRQCACYVRSQTVKFGVHHTWSKVVAADSLVKVSKTSATMPKYSQVTEYDRGEYCICGMLESIITKNASGLIGTRKAILPRYCSYCSYVQNPHAVLYECHCARSTKSATNGG